MNIVIGSDHGGFELKEYLKEYLKSEGFSLCDMGADSIESVDYPDYAKKVCEFVLSKEAEFGILVCGSGIGMSMAANRFEGIRAALVSEPLSAELSRRHNDSNVLCLGGRIIGKYMAVKILEAFLHTSFEGGRHEIRIKKLDNMTEV